MRVVPSSAYQENTEPGKKKFASFRLFLLFFLFLIIVVTFFFREYFQIFFTESVAYAFLKQRYEPMLVRYEASRYNNYRGMVARNMWHALLSASSFPKIDRINFHIPFRHLKLLERERERSLASGEYQISDRTYVPVRIEYFGKSYRARIRLKGERQDHLEHPQKWSFRVKMRGADRLFGMKIFSLQSPHTRHYQIEPVVLYSMQETGIITPRYRFVKTSINGDSIGLMALEEQFTKEMIESQHRREGVVLRLDDSRLVETYFALRDHPIYPRLMQKIEEAGLPEIYRNVLLHTSGPFSGIGITYFNAFTSPIRIYEEPRLRQNPTLSLQAEAARALFRGALHGTIPVEQVFDTKKFGEFLALQWFWMAEHPSSFRNQRFYFNPVTYLFEPIAYDNDAYSVQGIDATALSKDRFDNQISRIINRSPKTLQAFQDSAEIIYREVQNGVFLQNLMRKEEEYLRILRPEYKTLPSIPFRVLKGNVLRSIERIRSGNYFQDPETVSVPVNIPKDLKLPGIINAYLVSIDGKQQIEFENLFPKTVKITDLSSDRKDFQDGFNTIISKQSPIYLPPTKRDQAAKVIRVDLPGKLSPEQQITGEAQFEDQSQVYPFTVVPSVSFQGEYALRYESLFDIQKEYPFLKISADQSQVTVPRGSWNVSTMLRFPPAVRIVFEAGAEVSFAPGAGVLARGPVHLMGKTGAKVLLKPQGEIWSGITILGADRVSLWKNAEIHQTTFANWNQWKLTGGVNFYESDIEMEKVSFLGTQAEDALNIIRSHCQLKEIKIQNTRSDAFDGDFVNGKIQKSFFQNIGGDAVDVSGSEISVQESVFSEVQDKAISAGERSKVFVNTVQVQDSGTGIASKDSSLTTVQNSRFQKLRYASFMAFQKKPEFQGAKLIANEVYFENKKDALLVQKGSQMLINEIPIRTRDIDIEVLYKTGYMKKASTP